MNRRILIFRTGSIGDNICSMPALASIRKHFSESEIHLLTDEGSQNLLSLNNLLSNNYFDKVINYSGISPLKLMKMIRQENYDLIIELPHNVIDWITEVRNMIFFRLAGIPGGFGWHITTSFSFRQRQEKFLQFQSEADNLLGIIKSHGVAILLEKEYPMNFTESDKTTVDKILGQIPTEFIQKKLVAIVPGAKRSQNRYPMERFVVLVKWLINKNYTVVVIGGSDDLSRGTEIEKQNGAISLCGRLTPIQSAILLSKCFATISNDTGPMHMSYAVGTPVIGLFSSRDFQQKWFPPEGNIALRNYNVHCSMCFSESCSNNICMQGIPIEQIKSAFMQLELQAKAR